MKRALGVLLLCLTAVPAMAALSPKFKEWGDGPAQWIMTSDEQRAWRKVATDTDAVNFIDLFWARRDPSAGTAVNEYRNEFESRVAYSDETFIEKRKRGAMTDRGRVYIVLGPGTFMNTALSQTGGQMGIEGRDPTGGHRMGQRFIWLWEHADARKFDLPRIEVVFVEDPSTKRIQRDPRLPDFGRAEPRAIRKSLVNPDLTAVPEWAATGGLEPVARVNGVEVHFDPPAPAPAPTTAPPVDEGPAVASTTPGVSRLTLLSRGSIDARSAADPFAVQSDTTFKGGRDVPWAVQYCSPTAEVPKLKYMLYMAGASEQRTKEKDAKLERMTSQPGCYVLQGMMPISKLAPGRYKLTVMIDDVDMGDAYSVKGDFSVE